MSQRDRIRMSEAEVAAFLDEPRTMSIATLDPDGWPHLVAMWYAVLDGSVHFWTYAKSRKAVNLRRDPRLTCLVEAGERYDELRGVSLTGRAVLITDTPRVADIGMAISERYAGSTAVAEQRDALRAGVEAQALKRVAVRVSVERLASWDHRKLVEEGAALG
jgi:PPOX class probable F420-dependent enzyme